MKKNSFIEGTVIATLGIILVKVIGIMYVIPFNAIIGEQGGALYGYAYNIYQLFLSISSAGFPFAISKITSEYSALGYKRAVYDTYKLSVVIISIISVVVFLLLFIFAPQIGKLIIGDAVGSNSYADIGFVIRMISFSILVVPFLSVTKGFLQGYKYITPSSVSQLIEQIVRVIVILVGSYLCLNVFDLGLRNAVGVAVSGAFFGGLAAYLYLRRKIKKAKLLVEGENKDGVIVTKKEIVRKIIGYSVPFIVISLVYNLYNSADMILLSRTMSGILGYDAHVVESVVAVYTTWGVKLNNIILAVSTGLITSLIPNIVSSYTKGDMDDVNGKFNKAIQCVLLVIVPMTIFLSLLVDPVWTLFYGSSRYGPDVYRVFVFTALFGGLYNIVVNTLQGLSKYKLVIVTVLLGLFLNVTLDVPLMVMFDNLGYNPSYGASLAAIVGFGVAIMVTLLVLNRKYGFKFSDTLKKLPSFIGSYVIFVIVILGLRLVIPTDLEGRFIQIPILILYGVISFGGYIGINYINGNLKSVFNIDLIKIKEKLVKKRKSQEI